MKQLYSAIVTNGINYECLGDEELGLLEGDAVVVKCERYVDNATISGKIGEPIEDVDEFERQRNLNNKGRHIEGQKLPVIMRKVNSEDQVTIDENKTKALTAHSQTRERIIAHGLEMKLIHTHYALDQKLILFLFSAEGRIDFRELLRDLSALFRIRVELRQVGVRDEACLLGGIGTCGRPFCCSTFLNNFNSINVKMAKQQGISLNPQNISGCCGRLKCCLYYEAEAYKDTIVPCKNKMKNDEEEREQEQPVAKENTQQQREREHVKNRHGKPRENQHNGENAPQKEVSQRQNHRQEDKHRHEQRGGQRQQTPQHTPQRREHNSQNHQGQPRRERNNQHQQRQQGGQRQGRHHGPNEGRTPQHNQNS